MADFLADRPAPEVEPGQTIEDALNNITLPQCTVGQAGLAGNPTDFEEILRRWNGGTALRSTLNPIALMRIWASIYRTYNDWVLSTNRSFVSNTEVELEIENTLIDPRSYRVEYKALSTGGSIEDQETTGRLIDLSDTNSTTNLSGFTTVRDGLPSQGLQTGELAGIQKPVSGGALTNGLMTFDLYPSLYTGEKKPFTNIGVLFGGPIEMITTFDTPTDIESLLNPVPDRPAKYGNANFANEDLTNWFQPYDYNLRRTEEGSNNITASLFLGSLVQQPNLSPVPFSETTGFESYNTLDLRRQVGYQNWDPTTSGTHNIDNFTYLYPEVRPGSSIRLSKGNVQIDDRTNGDYDFSPFSSYFPTTGNGAPIFKIPSTRTFQVLNNNTGNYDTATISCSLQVDSKAQADRFNVYPRYFQKNNLFSLDSPTRIRYSVYINTPSNRYFYVDQEIDKSIYLNNVKKLSITSGFDDYNNNLELRKYFVGFPYYKGLLRRSVVRINENSIVEELPANWENIAFYQNNNPTSFVISGTTYFDRTAFNAFALGNELTTSNLDQWRLLPYTLPYYSSTFNLQEDMEASPLLRNIPIGFDYTEDYISNSLIPFPTISQLSNIEQQAELQNTTGPELYYRNEFNKLLDELVSYCKATCLRFWTNTQLTLVRDYRNYTNNTVRVNNLNRPVSGTFGSISIYEVDTPVDIRSSNADRLWFLSGGTNSRVDIDTAVLLRLQELTGLIQ